MTATQRGVEYSVRRFAGIGLTLAVVLCSLAPFSRAQDAAQHPGPTAAAALTAEDVAAFYDGLIPVQLRRDDIAGAVIAVVKDGRVLFAKGYGYSDVETGRSVSPESTLFRPASISKLFTWTAVMQLVEQGRLDLDQDVNQYLDFQIPATFAQPITLRNLMTHTAGFQETIRLHYLGDGDGLRPLRYYLTEHMPPRIFAPGTTPAYSNYGAALAGYIVQRVSGQAFEDYVDEHIFQPLGMQHSTFVQPLPDSLKSMMSSGYMNGSEPATPFELIPTFPSGGLSSTAEDLTRFMIAHLQDGSFGEGRILKAETARLMHAREIELAPGMNGMSLGFAEEVRNGYRAIVHGGDTHLFHSKLYLVPELGLGLFFSQNSLGRGGDLRSIVWRSFLDRYFPPATPVNSATMDPRSDVRALCGWYKVTRRFDVSILKLTSLMSQVLVSANADGTIRCDLIGDKPLREVGPLKYCDAKDEDCIAFRKDAAGKPEIVVAFPHVVFQRVPWYEARPLNLNVIAVSTGVFGLTLALWPIAAVTRWRFGRRLNLTQAERRMRLLIRLICGIDLGCILAGRGLFRSIWGRLPVPPLPDAHLDLLIHLVQVVGIAGAVATLVVVYDAVRCWSNRDRWWFSKVHASAVALACIGFVWFALVWDLFDFSARY